MQTLRTPLPLAGLFTLFALLILAQPAPAADTIKQGALEISGAWARATPPGSKNGGAFLTVTNAGGGDDKLMAAASDVANRVELHNHINDNGVMRMRQVPFIPVPKGGKAELKPGSYHVMFMGLKAPLKEGGMVMVKLTFEKAGEVMVHMPVLKGMGKMKPGMMMNHKHGG